MVNRMRRSRMRLAVRNLRKVLEKDPKAAAALVPETFSIIDRAAKWGIIQDNTAARYKSRIDKRLKSISGAPAAA